jgi:hypothetical protein
MRKISLAIGMLLLLFACSPSMKTTSSWINQDKSIFQNKPYKTIFISVITSKQEVRAKLENEMAIAAEQHGYVAVKSIDKFPIIGTDKKPTKEEILELIKNTGTDLIFTTALVDEHSETRYVRGTVTYSPRFYGGYRGYYGGAWTYYEPGYYTTDKTYFLESNLFDAATEAVIWSAQSEVYNPTSIEKTSKKYVELMLNRLESDGILKRSIK